MASKVLLSLFTLGFVLGFSPPAVGQQSIGFNCNIAQDRIDDLLGDLSRVTNLTNALGCRKDSACIVQAVLKQVAKEKGLPEGLIFSVAWTESNWQQWDNRGYVVRSYTNDSGIMQINKRAWGHKYDWQQIEGDTLYNARAGADILKWSYDYARRRGYRGADLWKSTYAVYNGGPRAVHRPFNPSSRFAHHDRNYARHARNHPWESRTANCGSAPAPVVVRPTPPPVVVRPAPAPAPSPTISLYRRPAWFRVLSRLFGWG